VAKTGTASDALSTTLLLVGPERGKSIVMSMTDAAAIWVSPGGQAEIASSGPQIFLGKGVRKEVAEASSRNTSCGVN
jgi:thiamine biosynthesis lipoprotein ApbE